MLYTNTLLRRYLSLDLSPQEIAERLTLRVCEVEEIHERVLPEKVVIGKVTKVESHPNADKLVVCQIDCGDKGSYQICTGATNVVADSYVPVAIPGCFLPSINLQIEPREMRGEESNGMICSKEELGIAEDLEEKWIWTLQNVDGTGETDMDDLSEADLGKPLGEKYPRLESWTIDVDNKTITHRPDLFGHFGMSVELQAHFPEASKFSAGKQYIEQIQEHAIFDLLAHADVAQMTAKIETEQVAAFTLLEITNVAWSRSDLYTRLALLELGLVSKGNWIDLSNLFMYQTGQPIHCYDATKIDGEIVVRNAKEGEQFTDLFDKTHTLTSDDIVIADEKKLLGLAGIIGSNNSGVDETTTQIIAELGNFDPIQVRRTGMRLGLRTDAEVRFEKGINPLYSLHALTMLLDELKFSAKNLGSYELGGIFSRRREGLSGRSQLSIALDRALATRMVWGAESDDQSVFIDESLQRLGCQIKESGEVIVPAWRGPEDLTIQADLIEEIARMVGFDQIAPTSYTDESAFVPFSSEVQRQRTIESLFTTTLGYDQVETYPWLHDRWIERFQLSTDQLYTMQNALDPDATHLRPFLWISLLELIEKNAPFFEKMHLFDIGKSWTRDRDEHEHTVLAWAIYQKQVGERSDSGWLRAKGVVTTLLEALSIQGKLDYNATTDRLFHPGQQGEIILNGRAIGTIHTLHPYQAEKSKLPATSRTVFTEIDLTALAQIAAQQRSSHNVSYTTLQDQIVQRDLNFVIDQSVGYGFVASALQKVKEISQVEVFDLYAGEHLPAGKKSIGLRISLSADEQLENDQINEIMTKAIEAAKKIGAELRS